MMSTLMKLGLAVLATWAVAFAWFRWQRYAYNGFGRIPLLPKSLPKVLKRALG
jgi:hypothetical protein